MILKSQSQPIINEAEVDYSSLKITALIGLTVLSVAAFAYFFSHNNLLLSFTFSFLSLSFFVLQSLLIKDFSKIAFGVLIETAVLVLIIGFYRDFSLSVLISASSIFFVFVLIGHYQGMIATANSLKIKFSRIAYAVLPAAGLGLSIFISLMFGFSIDQNIITSRGVFDYLIKPAVPVFRIYVKDFSLEMKAGDFINQWTKNIFEKQVSANKELEMLSPAAQQQIFKRISEDLIKSFEGYLGAPLNLDKSLSENFYFAFKRLVELLFDTFLSYYISLAIAALMFLLFRFFVFVFIMNFIVMFLAFIIYEILLITNFAVVSLETRSREIVLLK